MPNETPAMNLELLIKLLKMTTSSHDAEALVAMRKANELVSRFGDWERLIRGKVTIVGDPFGAIDEPPSRNRGFGRAPDRPKYPTQSQTQWYADPDPQPAPKPKPKSPGVMPNNFAGDCWCCGLGVPANQGKVFKPGDHVSIALITAPLPKWAVICPTCDVPGVFIPATRVTRRPPRSGPSASSLA